eukprot:m.206079 g.206079  ORF g.206079 m.206079 type:complete len:939 (-) comp15019_c2_seq2:159-2975(-)
MSGAAGVELKASSWAELLEKADVPSHKFQEEVWVDKATQMLKRGLKEDNPELAVFYCYRGIHIILKMKSNPPTKASVVMCQNAVKSRAFGDAVARMESLKPTLEALYTEKASAPPPSQTPAEGQSPTSSRLTQPVSSHSSPSDMTLFGPTAGVSTPVLQPERTSSINTDSTDGIRAGAVARGINGGSGDTEVDDLALLLPDVPTHHPTHSQSTPPVKRKHTTPPPPPSPPSLPSPSPTSKAAKTNADLLDPLDLSLFDAAQPQPPQPTDAQSIGELLIPDLSQSPSAGAPGHSPSSTSLVSLLTPTVMPTPPQGASASAVPAEDATTDTFAEPLLMPQHDTSGSTVLDGTTISPQELHALLGDDNVLLFDLRSPQARLQVRVEPLYRPAPTVTLTTGTLPPGLDLSGLSAFIPPRKQRDFALRSTVPLVIIPADSPTDQGTTQTVLDALLLYNGGETLPAVPRLLDGGVHRMYNMYPTDCVASDVYKSDVSAGKYLGSTTTTGANTYAAAVSSLGGSDMSMLGDESLESLLDATPSTQQKSSDITFEFDELEAALPTFDFSSSPQPEQLDAKPGQTTKNEAEPLVALPDRTPASTGAVVQGQEPDRAQDQHQVRERTAQAQPAPVTIKYVKDPRLEKQLAVDRQRFEAERAAFEEEKRRLQDTIAAQQALVQDTVGQLQQTVAQQQQQQALHQQAQKQQWQQELESQLAAQQQQWQEEQQKRLNTAHQEAEEKLKALQRETQQKTQLFQERERLLIQHFEQQQQQQQPRQHQPQQQRSMPPVQRTSVEHMTDGYDPMRVQQSRAAPRYHQPRHPQPQPQPQRPPGMYVARREHVAPQHTRTDHYQASQHAPPHHEPHQDRAPHIAASQQDPYRRQEYQQQYYRSNDQYQSAPPNYPPPQHRQQHQQHQQDRRYPQHQYPPQYDARSHPAQNSYPRYPR